MHEAAFGYVAQTVAELELSGSVLDLGGRDVNGTVHGLFPGSTFTIVDIEPHPSVDVVADAADLQLDERFDVVISTECFEHTPKGPEITATAHKHLVDGGVFVATMAGPGRTPHGASGEKFPPLGEWYRNVFPAELDEWLSAAGFEKWEIDVSGPDVRCWARK